MIRLRIEDIPPKFVAYIVAKAGLTQEDLQLIPGQFEHTITGFYAEKIGEKINVFYCSSTSQCLKASQSTSLKQSKCLSLRPKYKPKKSKLMSMSTLKVLVNFKVKVNVDVDVESMSK